MHALSELAALKESVANWEKQRAMNWFKEKRSSVTNKVAESLSKASDNIAAVDLRESFSSIADAASAAATKAKKLGVQAYSATKDSAANTHDTVAEKISSFDYEQLSTDIKESAESIVDTAGSVANKTWSLGAEACSSAKNSVVSTVDAAVGQVTNFDYSQLTDQEFYSRQYTYYRDLSVTKVTELFKSTFEVDKETKQMVDEIKARLPVPVNTVDDIFEQCKSEAIRRAIAVFALGGVMQREDEHSAKKYENLSEKYSDFAKKNAYQMKQSKPFIAMANERTDAVLKIGEAGRLTNGYNKSDALHPGLTDIEHVISKKELYEDVLIRIGTTNDQYFDLINNAENLVFADQSLNRSMGAKDILRYIQERGRPVEGKPGFVAIDIEQKDGSIKVVEVNEADARETFRVADEERQQERKNSIVEIGRTVAVTGATMAAQQVVGLIIVETIDIFVDEVKLFSHQGRIINSDGWLNNSKDSAERIRNRLNQRFEERQIWAKAKEAGLEAGVVGSLSIIPQIIISMIVKVPAFVLALIRECTLSVVRCVRVLLSDDPNKLESISVLLAGTASAIVGLYVSRAISSGIRGVPLLRRFDAEISNVLSGVIVTAVPLVAIYTFEQNKAKFRFATLKFSPGHPMN